jgi:hypothetical protein
MMHTAALHVANFLCSRIERKIFSPIRRTEGSQQIVSQSGRVMPIVEWNGENHFPFEKLMGKEKLSFFLCHSINRLSDASASIVM